MSCDEGVGRLVAAAAVLVDGLHHDPVQVRLDEAADLRRVNVARLRQLRAFLVRRWCSSRDEGFTGSTSRMMRRISS